MKTTVAVALIAVLAVVAAGVFAVNAVTASGPLAIRDEPRNAQQLAEGLALDYKTVRHHLRVLGKNGLVTTAGERYGQVYFLSPSIESRWAVFENIVRDMQTRGDRRGTK